MASGIEEILIISGHAKHAMEDHFDSSPELEQHLLESGKTKELEEIRKISGIKVHYVRQPYMRGLGDAILCAKDFVDDEPFGVILGDDVVYNGDNDRRVSVGCQGAGVFLWYHRWETRDGS